jgi:hypothetical protein
VWSGKRETLASSGSHCSGVKALSTEITSRAQLVIVLSLGGCEARYSVSQCFCAALKSDFAETGVYAVKAAGRDLLGD